MLPAFGYIFFVIEQCLVVYKKSVLITILVSFMAICK